MPELNDVYSYAWYAWGALFVVIEGLALKNKNPGDTLSEHIWNIFKVDKETPWVLTPRKVALGGFMAWLATHFFTGGVI